MTPWDDIIKLFLFKVQKNAKFFNYYNVNEEEAMELAKILAKGFLLESVIKIMSTSSPDVDFNDFDESLEQFNFQMTYNEKDLIARIMLEMYFEKDMARLSVASNFLSSQDIKYVFSGWHERNSFMAMFEKLQAKNELLIKKYASKDRLSGQRKFIAYEL